MRRYVVGFSKHYIGGVGSWPSVRLHTRVIINTRLHLIVVPAIIVEEPELPNLSVPRPMPSLDLTQMRNDMGAGYSPTSPTFGQESLQVRYSPQSDGEDESSSPFRTWSSIGGPESQIATSTVQSGMYSSLSVVTDFQISTNERGRGNTSSTVIGRKCLG